MIHELLTIFVVINIKVDERGEGMNRVKKGLDTQAIGFLPLLLCMFLDNYFSY